MNIVEVKALKDLHNAFKQQASINQDLVTIVERLAKRVSILEHTLKMMRDQR